MLKQLFSSQARVKLLTYFFQHSEEEFFVRELTRALEEQVNSIRRELKNLDSIGLLKSKTKLNRKYYYLDRSFILYPELESIIKKTTSLDTNIGKEIGKLGDVKLVVLSGVFADDPKSKVDLFIVGDVSGSSLDKFLEKRMAGSGEDLRYALMSEEDFLYRLQCRDKFVLDILRGNANILALNRLSKKIQI